MILDLLPVMMEGHLRSPSPSDLLRRKRARRFCDHCNDMVSHAHFYHHNFFFFRNGVWIKDATTQDNSSVEINAELDDCARDESLDPSEVKNVLDVPLGKLLNLFYKVKIYVSKQNDI